MKKRNAGGKELERLEGFQRGNVLETLRKPFLPLPQDLKTEFTIALEK